MSTEPGKDIITSKEKTDPVTVSEPENMEGSEVSIDEDFDEVIEMTNETDKEINGGDESLKSEDLHSDIGEEDSMNEGESSNSMDEKPTNGNLSEAVKPEGKAKDSKLATGSKKASTKPKRSAFGFLLNVILVLGLVYLTFLFLGQRETFDQIIAQQTQNTQQQTTFTGSLTALQQRAQELDGQLADAISLISAQGTRLTDASNLLSTQSSQLSAATDRITAQTSQLDQARNLIAEQGVELDRLNREIINTRLRISETGGSTNLEWKLSEVESSLRIAQQELIVSRDVRAAIALFVASDDILRQINDPAIFSIREILASELTALRAVPEIDVQGIHSELSELNQRLTNLQVITGAEEQLPVDREVVPLQVEGETEEDGIFNAVLNKINEYIVVRRRDEAIQPLLSLEQQSYLKQNVHLQIQQASLALMQEQEQVYRSSIGQAIESIELYLLDSDAEKQNILTSLRALQARDIVVIVPTVTNSLRALREILVVNSSIEEASAAL